MKHCKNCGKENKSGKYLYCSDKCKKDAYIKNLMKYDRPCAVCGKSIVKEGLKNNKTNRPHDYSDKKYCSLKCSGIAFSRIKKEDKMGAFEYSQEIKNIWNKKLEIQIKLDWILRAKNLFFI